MECLNCFYCVFCALCPVPCNLCPVPCDLCPVPCALCPVTWPVTCDLRFVPGAKNYRETTALYNRPSSFFWNKTSIWIVSTITTVCEHASLFWDCNFSKTTTLIESFCQTRSIALCIRKLEIWPAGNYEFKVDRLQIILVAKKYIPTCRNCSSVGCLKCVQFHNWFRLH